VEKTANSDGKLAGVPENTGNASSLKKLVHLPGEPAGVEYSTFYGIVTEIRDSPLPWFLLFT
jgi:hypothetical protein